MCGGKEKVSEITDLQAEIAAWADTLFPDRTVHDVTRKLVCEELPEFLLDPVPGELADVLILVFDLANLLGIDVHQAILDKVKINANRRWRQDPDSGLMKHVKEED